MGTVDAAQAAGAGVAGFDEIGSEARPTEAPTSLLDGYLFVAKDDISDDFHNSLVTAGIRNGSTYSWFYVLCESRDRDCLSILCYTRQRCYRTLPRRGVRRIRGTGYFSVSVGTISPDLFLIQERQDSPLIQNRVHTAEALAY